MSTPAASAVNGDARDRRVIREALDLIVDLRGQFARGREHQRACGAVLGLEALAVLPEEPRENREQIGRRLARAGFGAADHILALQGVREDGALNGRGLFEPALRERVEQIGIGDQRRKRNRRGVERRRLAAVRRGHDRCGAGPSAPASAGRAATTSWTLRTAGRCFGRQGQNVSGRGR
jgi:hypothetical protein